MTVKEFRRFELKPTGFIIKEVFVTVFPMLVGTVTQIFGYTISFLFYLPYVPFELGIGLWIVAKGIEEPE